MNVGLRDKAANPTYRISRLELPARVRMAAAPVLVQVHAGLVNRHADVKESSKPEVTKAFKS